MLETGRLLGNGGQVGMQRGAEREKAKRKQMQYLNAWILLITNGKETAKQRNN